MSARVVKAEGPNCFPCVRQAESGELQAMRERLDSRENNTQIRVKLATVLVTSPSYPARG